MSHDFFVPTLGDLVSTLRAQRGLTQDELGRRVGVDRNTIARTEQGKGTWYRRTAMSIFETLARVLPFTVDEAEEFLRLADLDPGLARAPFVRDPAAPPPRDTAAEIAAVTAALERALEAATPEQVVAALDAVVAALGAARPVTQQGQPGPPREVSIASPPRVPFPGAVEQTRTTYRVKDDHPPAKPKAKKRTG